MSMLHVIRERNLRLSEDGGTGKNTSHLPIGRPSIEAETCRRNQVVPSFMAGQIEILTILR